MYTQLAPHVDYRQTRDYHDTMDFGALVRMDARGMSFTDSFIYRASIYLSLRACWLSEIGRWNKWRRRRRCDDYLPLVVPRMCLVIFLLLLFTYTIYPKYQQTGFVYNKIIYIYVKCEAVRLNHHSSRAARTGRDWDWELKTQEMCLVKL